MSSTFYQQNIDTAKSSIKEIEKKINLNSFYRLFLMLGGGIVVFQLFKTNNIFLVLGAIFLFIFLFAYFVFKQSKLDRSLQEAQVFLKINENEINLKQNSPNLYDDGHEYDDSQHPYSSDLDVFGKNSLFSKLNRCATIDGKNKLMSWLSAASSKEQIIERQNAIEELKNDPVHLQTFQSKMFFNLGSGINLRAYVLSYFQDRSFEFGNLFLRLYVLIVPWIFLIGFIFSFLVYNIGIYLVLLGVIHLLWTISQAGKIGQFSNRIDKIGVSLIGYAQAIKLIEDRTYSSSLCTQIQEKVVTHKQQKKLSEIIHELGRLIDKLDVRNNMLVGAILNILFLWDFKQIMAIVKWKKKHEDNIISGFESIATYEGLISLSILSYNYPGWCKPVIHEQGKGRIAGVDINHPLILNDRAVGNDFDTQDHSITLITGSNMAGKSTFLRTIGINAILAYSGAVVCAKSFEIPIYDIVTYMRIKDSLNESTSTFKAELNRMKFILDHVEQQKTTFFLVDEMLRGTNSVDKYLGSEAIIKKFIELNGNGMLATHDLQLSQLAEEFPDKLKNYHFDIQIQHGEMLFDYKLKNGPCKIFNASMLLKEIGIEVENKFD